MCITLALGYAYPNLQQVYVLLEYSNVVQIFEHALIIFRENFCEDHTFCKAYTRSIHLVNIYGVLKLL